MKGFELRISRWQRVSPVLNHAVVQVVLLVHIVMVTASAVTQPAGPEQNTKANLPFPARWLYSALPATMKNPVDRYLEMTGLNVSRIMNQGIRQFNQQRIDKNICFSQVAAEFYADLRNERVDGLLGLLEGQEFDPNFKASLKDTAQSRGKEPGWLWSKAKKFAGGDSNLAMNIIGICGHDDTEQLEKHLPVTVREEQFHKKLKDAYDYQTSAINQSEFPPTAERARAVEALKDELSRLDRTSTFGGSKSCPFIGPFYLPQSLGASADIPDDLKSRIAQIQAPTGGPSSLKAKSYHLYVAAYIACELRSMDTPKFVTQILLDRGVNAYRTMRLCQNNMSPWPHQLPTDVNELVKLRLSARDEPDCQPITVPERKDSNGVTHLAHEKTNPKYFTNHKCIAASMIAGAERLDMTSEILKKKFERRLAHSDVADLLKRSVAYKLSNDCKGPQVFKYIRDYLSDHGSQGRKNPCPKEWASARCKNARELMATYAIDFEWSAAQQRAGVEFAYQNCHIEPDKQALEKSACRALEALKSKPGPVGSTNNAPTSK